MGQRRCQCFSASSNRAWFQGNQNILAVLVIGGNWAYVAPDVGAPSPILGDDSASSDRHTVVNAFGTQSVDGSLRIRILRRLCTVLFFQLVGVSLRSQTCLFDCVAIRVRPANVPASGIHI